MGGRRGSWTKVRASLKGLTVSSRVACKNTRVTFMPQENISLGFFPFNLYVKIVMIEICVKYFYIDLIKTVKFIYKLKQSVQVMMCIYQRSSLLSQFDIKCLFFCVFDWSSEFKMFKISSLHDQQLLWCRGWRILCKLLHEEPSEQRVSAGQGGVKLCSSEVSVALCWIYTVLHVKEHLQAKAVSQASFSVTFTCFVFRWLAQLSLEILIICCSCIDFV